MARVGHLIKGLALAVTVMVAAVVFVPAAALAHAGHQPDVRQTNPPIVVAAPERAADVQVERDLVASAELAASCAALGATAASLKAGSDPQHEQACIHGCCHCAPCSGHFALPSSLLLSGPPQATVPLQMTVLAPPGITPAALPEPPKPFIR